MEANKTPEYEVAISFLVRDIALAQALRDKLHEGLKVFFFPHTQEDLAGTDGLETMQEPFRHSRINVVMYREAWGNTQWTRVESEAIRDACLEDGFESLFFFMVEDTAVLPRWLPKTRVRFNYGDFSLEQAVGAIKARVFERGGHFEPMTPVKRARLIHEEELYQSDRSLMKSQFGMQRVLQSVQEVLKAVREQIDAVNIDGSVEIECELKEKEKVCILRHGNLGMIVRWNQPFPTMLDSSRLSVEEYRGRLWFSGELGNRVVFRPPEVVLNTKYEPELSRAREYGWRDEEDSGQFLACSALADKCVLAFLERITDERINRV